MKDKLHRGLKLLVRTQRKHQLVLMNNIPLVKENCIYAVNHSCKWDFQYMIEITTKYFYVLAGRQRLRVIDRIAFILNGVVWVDRKNKNSKTSSKEKLIHLAKSGQSLCIFPEGTWNMEPSKPVLPLYWGVIDIAKTSGIPIVPVCMEYKEKCYVKFGKPIYMKEDEDKGMAIENLRDVFASLKWDIWELFPVEHRNDIENDYWDKEIFRRLKEYKKFDYEYEMSCIRQ